MKKILITGFEPFNKNEKNPSGDFIDWLSHQNVSDDRIVKGVILPVTFTTAFPLFQKIYDDFCPDIVFLTGLAENRKELSIERIGINWVDARIPDNDGVTLLAQKINAEGPDGLFTTINLEASLQLIKKGGSSMKVSTSAGEYVCNDLLYKVLCYTRDKKTAVTFIHIPGLQEYNGTYLALETLVNGL